MMIKLSLTLVTFMVLSHACVATVNDRPLSPYRRLGRTTPLGLLCAAAVGAATVAGCKTTKDTPLGAPTVCSDLPNDPSKQVATIIPRRTTGTTMACPIPDEGVCDITICSAPNIVARGGVEDRRVIEAEGALTDGHVQSVRNLLRKYGGFVHPQANLDFGFSSDINQQRAAAADFKQISDQGINLSEMIIQTLETEFGVVASMDKIGEPGFPLFKINYSRDNFGKFGSIVLEQNDVSRHQAWQLRNMGLGCHADNVAAALNVRPSEELNRKFIVWMNVSKRGVDYNGGNVYVSTKAECNEDPYDKTDMVPVNDDVGNFYGFQFTVPHSVAPLDLWGDEPCDLAGERLVLGITVELLPRESVNEQGAETLPTETEVYPEVYTVMEKYWIEDEPVRDEILSMKSKDAAEVQTLKSRDMVVRLREKRTCPAKVNKSYRRAKTPKTRRHRNKCGRRD